MSRVRGAKFICSFNVGDANGTKRMQSYVDAREIACAPPDTLAGAVISKLYQLGAMEEVHTLHQFNRRLEK